jgi:hypothetical protein
VSSVCVTSILRVTTLNVATAQTDIMWESIGSSMWTVIESNLGIIVACMPALRRPVMMFFPLLLGKMGHTSARGSQKYRKGYTDPSAPAMELDTPKRSLPSLATTDSRDGTWLDEDKPGSADKRLGEDSRYLGKKRDVVDVEDMGNSSDGDRGSGDHILKSKRNYNRKHIWNDITRTTETRVETTPGNSLRNTAYYPG